MATTGLLLALLAGSCGESSEETSLDTAETTVVDAERATQTLDLGAPTVALQQEGTGELVELRLSAPAGQIEQGAMEMTSSTFQEFDGVLTTSTSTTVIPITVEVLEVTADGALRVRTTYGKPELELIEATTAGQVATPADLRQATAAGQQTIEFLEGGEITYLLTPDGSASEVAVSIASASSELGPILDQLIQQSGQLADQMVVPMPTEAVGVGATWTVTRSLDVGISQDVTATYTVTSIDGPVVSLGVEVSAAAASQDFDLPGLGDAEARLVSSDTTATGQTVLDLRRLLPDPSTATSTSAQVLEVAETAGGRPQQLAQVLVFEMSLARDR